MGSSSSSTSNQKYTTNIVNTVDTNVLNKNINTFNANTTVSQAQACSAGIANNQSVNLSNMKIAGSLNIGGVSQSQTASLTFSCIQDSSLESELGNGMVSQYMDAIQNSFSASALAEMNATAGAAAKNSFGATGSTHTNSDTNVNYNFNSTNNVNTNIQNVVENAIQNNFNMSDVKNCIATVQNNQDVNFSGTQVGGNVNIGSISQEQAATLMTNCMQNTTSSNKVTNAVASELGIKVVSEGAVKTSASITTSSTAESTNQGVGEALGSVLTGIGNMIGGIFGGLFGGLFGMYAMYVGCCVILCIICCCSSSVIAAIGMMSQGKSSGESSGYDQGYDDQYGGYNHLHKILGIKT